MSTAPSQQGRQLALTDCLSHLAMIVGAIIGPVWGYAHYGVLGAFLGVPVGGILGLLSVFALFVTIALSVAGALSGWALARRGPRGLVLLFRYGPEAVAKGEPLPGETNQQNEAGR